MRDLFVDLVTAKLGDKMSPMAPPGHEGVGYVSKIGAEVTGVKEGDRVAGGGFRRCESVHGKIVQDPRL